ncbi:archaellin/type IV pilin N-terminal domain-containing protein [Candidatus Nitrosotenuis sp. DW1]|uniref:archaellin/type IV pilin N-terminal domain-containing protein n=1 Tax=Candidatus Nitrosotenuis sp. DW1 TaxID=2259672 RepID=UPI0015CE7D6D|nr:archaellin/type IV pilin N-terminal domain-containing protein [Candidatus Nitrosotenuis sp. DW1]QLH09347.1 hypothetical protein DSQ19_07535 [Candidatus Nitrosotenuis sp. DW1]
MKHRRGVSPILAVIILIGIAIVGGAFLSSAQNQILSATLSAIEYKVTDLRMEKDSSGTCYFFATLHNTGTEEILSTKINATSDGGFDWFPKSQPVNVSPSQILPVFEPFSGNPCGNFTASKTYSVGFEANSKSSSSKIIYPMTVTAVMKR